MRIGDEQNVALEKGQQVVLQFAFARSTAPGHGIDGLAAAFARDAAPARRATALARPPVELARTLLRFEDEHVVGFDELSSSMLIHSER